MSSSVVLNAADPYATPIFDSEDKDENTQKSCHGQCKRWRWATIVLGVLLLLVIGYWAWKSYRSSSSISPGVPTYSNMIPPPNNVPLNPSIPLPPLTKI